MRQLFSPKRRQILTRILTVAAGAVLATFTSRHGDKLSVNERVGVMFVIGGLFGLGFWLIPHVVRQQKRPPLRLIGGTLGTSAALLAISDPGSGAFLVMAIAALLFGAGAVLVLFAYGFLRFAGDAGPVVFGALAGGLLATTIYWTGMESGLWANHPLLGLLFSVNGMFAVGCLSLAFAERYGTKHAD